MNTLKIWRQTLTAITLLEILILLFTPSLVLTHLHLASGNGFVYDDAYISFRYSVNLANGYGLVWNPNGEPTQGYTNLLLVLFAAAGLKVGIQPLTTSHLLNWLGLFAVGLSFYIMTRQLFKRPFLRTIPALMSICLPNVLANAMTGMETLLWIGLVFMAIMLAQSYMRQPNRSLLIAHAVCSFLGCLTRPDTVVFSVSWFAILFIAMPASRRSIMKVTFGFGLVGLLYIVWLQVYFGAVLPNSFYVKVADSSSLPGLFYVQNFFQTQVPPLYSLPFVLGGLWFLRSSGKLFVVHLLLNGVLFILLGFYIYTMPLMGFYFRFILPVACVIFAWIGLSVAAIINVGLQWVEHHLSQLSGQFSRNLSFMLLICVAASLMILGLGMHIPVHTLQVNEQMGHALATIPDVSKILIAYHDVGIFPYISGAKFLDTVGLNDNQIARHAKQEGYWWVIEYVLNAHPDMIGFYTPPLDSPCKCTVDGTMVCRCGDGVVGNHYDEMIAQDYFKANYTYLGGFDIQWALVHWYIYNQSPYRAEIERAVNGIFHFTTLPKAGE